MCNAKGVLPDLFDNQISNTNKNKRISGSDSKHTTTLAGAICVKKT